MTREVITLEDKHGKSLIHWKLTMVGAESTGGKPWHIWFHGKICGKWATGG